MTPSDSRKLQLLRLHRPLVGAPTLSVEQLVGIALAGIAFNLAWRSGPATVASAAAVVALTIVLLRSGRLRSRSAKALALAAPIFAAALALRVSPWLTPLNLAAAWGLLVLAAGFSHRGRLFDAPPLTWANQGGRLALDALDALPLLERTARTYGRGADPGLVRSLALGVVIAVPVLAVLGGLLLSADSVFASVLGSLPAGDGAVHAATAMAGGLVALVLLRTSSGVSGEVAEAPFRIRPATAGVVLGALVLLYGAYAAVTVIAALRGADAFLDDPGEVADWARSGFFQLLAVTAVTAVILAALRALTERTSGKGDLAVRLAATLAILLTEVIAWAAISRIHAYSEAYGLTMLRLFSALFALWIGVVFVFLLCRFWNRPGAPEWLPAASFIAGLGILLGLNASNPEAFVVDWNIDHRDRVERFDVRYLVGLSEDALPALSDRFASLEALDQVIVRIAVCDGDSSAGGPAWNYGDWAADGARTAICR